jgi:hypothetical protein
VRTLGSRKTFRTSKGRASGSSKRGKAGHHSKDGVCEPDVPETEEDSEMTMVAKRQGEDEGGRLSATLVPPCSQPPPLCLPLPLPDGPPSRPRQARPVKGRRWRDRSRRRSASSRASPRSTRPAPSSRAAYNTSATTLTTPLRLPLVRQHNQPWITSSKHPVFLPELGRVMEQWPQIFRVLHLLRESSSGSCDMSLIIC